MRRPSSTAVRLAQRTERGTEFFREELWLLPRGEVAAAVERVEVDEVWIRALRPAARSRVDLIGEDTDGSRDRHVLGCEKGKLALPIETSGRNSGVREPVERDVVEDVISREALGRTIKDTRDERLTRRVVVEHPGCQADWRIGNRVQRLWTERHLLRVAQALLVEKVELIPRVQLVRGKAGWRGAARRESFGYVIWDGGRHVGVDAD